MDFGYLTQTFRTFPDRQGLEESYACAPHRECGGASLLGAGWPMNKTDLIRSISDSTGIKLTEATRLVDAVFDTIVSNLRKGEQVAVSGFGTFVAKTKAAREGRNPATGQPIHIPSRTTASF